MANYCEITGKRSVIGGRWSNKVRANNYNPTGKVRRRPNLHDKTFYVPEKDTKVKLTVSARAIRIINKIGIFAALKKAGYKY